MGLPRTTLISHTLVSIAHSGILATSPLCFQLRVLRDPLPVRVVVKRKWHEDIKVLGKANFLPQGQGPL